MYYVFNNFYGYYKLIGKSLKSILDNIEGPSTKETHYSKNKKNMEHNLRENKNNSLFILFKYTSKMYF